MGWRTLEVHVLDKAPWNYKRDDPDMQAALEANMRRNGQLINLIVRPSSGCCRWEVINGNHRLDALKALGVKEAQCFDTGPISNAAAKRLAVETNETNFPTDYLSLSEAVEAMLREFDLGDLAETMPYTDTELAHFRDMIGFNWEALAMKSGGGGDSVSLAVSRTAKERIEAVRMREGLRTNSDAVAWLLKETRGEEGEANAGSV